MPCIGCRNVGETAAGLMGWNDQSYPQVFVLTVGCDYRVKLTVSIKQTKKVAD